MTGHPDRLDIDAVLSDIQADVAATRLALHSLIRKVDAVAREVIAANARATTPHPNHTAGGGP